MKKIMKLAFCLLIGALFLTGCGKDAKRGADKDALIVAQGADAKTLDPHATNDQPSSAVAIQIYNTLVEQDPDMKIIPSLAESWTQPDDTTTVFNLRRGVKFHNGEELKSSDVKFTLDRAMASPQVNFIVEVISEVETPDDYTVVVKTKQPFGALLNHLAHSAMSILSEKAVREAGEKYGQNPVGTGPYKFVSWQSGDRITLKANPDYFEGKPAVENVIFRNIPENQSRAIALETGEVDICYGIDVIDKERIKGNKDLVYLEGPSLSMTYIGFNVQKKPLDDVRIRQAVCYAIDADAIIEAVWKGAATKANSIIGPNVFGYNKDARLWTRDVEKAKALLAAAGYPDGFQVKIWLNDNQQRRDMAVIMQDQLKEAGIDMTIEMVEWAAFLDGTARGDHEMYVLGWVTVTGDADYGIYPLLHSSQHGGAGNRSFYTNPAVDELLDQAKGETDQEKRKALYAQVQDANQEQVPIFPVCYGYSSVGLRKNVKGFVLRATSHYKLYGITLENTK
ncbi:MAG: glutathione ABC transporter substrate-binding protein [Fusobacteriaceae bacterium]|jgi:peptide/nickel transport system substrate-binding protein|nr:glutathione ABC transporter substrate-binding protein [Fusobacteriaceae bacterium]